MSERDRRGGSGGIYVLIAVALIIGAVAQFVVRYAVISNWECEITAKSEAIQDPRAFREQFPDVPARLGVRYGANDGCLTGDKCWFIEVGFFGQRRSSC